MKNESFEDKVARMIRIQKGEEAYGEGSSGSAAQRYQAEVLVDEMVERGRGRSNLEALPGSCELLISLTGFSPVTTLLAFGWLKPKALLLISSRNAQDGIDLIHAQTVGRGRLRAMDFHHRQCNPADPKGIYKLIRDFLENQVPDVEPKEICRHVVLDITGGKKVMSASGAFAAWQLNLGLCYVESEEYDPDLRMPRPGKDRLLILPNPGLIFMDQQLHETDRLFQEGSYGAAAELYRHVAETADMPAAARLRFRMAAFYAALCDFDVEKIRAEIGLLDDELSKTTLGLPQAWIGRVKSQMDFLLRALDEEGGAEMMVVFFLLGKHYRRIGRQDFAVLFFYRAIEGALVHRLCSYHPEFDPKKPDYSLIFDEPDQLPARLSQVAARMKLVPGPYMMPYRPGYLDSLGMLVLLEDPLLRGMDVLDHDRRLSSLATLNQIRNSSILAHGQRPVSPKDATDFEHQTCNLLEAFWRLERPQTKSFKDLVDALSLIQQFPLL